jgi:hypothetical protein
MLEAFTMLSIASNMLFVLGFLNSTLWLLNRFSFPTSMIPLFLSVGHLLTLLSFSLILMTGLLLVMILQEAVHLTLS